MSNDSSDNWRTPRTPRAARTSRAAHPRTPWQFKYEVPDFFGDSEIHTFISAVKRFNQMKKIPSVGIKAINAEGQISSKDGNVVGPFKIIVEAATSDAMDEFISTSFVFLLNQEFEVDTSMYNNTQRDAWSSWLASTEFFRKIGETRVHRFASRVSKITIDIAIDAVDKKLIFKVSIRQYIAGIHADTNGHLAYIVEEVQKIISDGTPFAINRCLKYATDYVPDSAPVENVTSVTNNGFSTLPVENVTPVTNNGFSTLPVDKTPCPSPVALKPTEEPTEEPTKKPTKKATKKLAKKPTKDLTKTFVAPLSYIEVARLHVSNGIQELAKLRDAAVASAKPQASPNVFDNTAFPAIGKATTTGTVPQSAWPRTMPAPPAPVVVETPTPVVVETPAPVVVETPAPALEVEAPTPVVVETPAPVVVETPAPVVVVSPAIEVVETPAHVVVETPTPVVVETPAIVADDWEELSVTEEDAAAYNSDGYNKTVAEAYAVSETSVVSEAGAASDISDLQEEAINIMNDLLEIHRTVTTDKTLIVRPSTVISRITEVEMIELDASSAFPNHDLIFPKICTAILFGHSIVVSIFCTYAVDTT